MGRAASPARRGSAPREIDDHGPHHLGSPAQKVDAVVEMQGAGGGEAQVRFVHQRRRIEQRIAPARGKPDARQLAEIGVHRGKQTVGGRGVPFFCTLNQIGQVQAIVHVRRPAYIAAELLHTA